MKFKNLFFILVLFIPFIQASNSNAIGLANCVSVSSAEVVKEFGNLVYSLKVRDLCDPGIRSYKLTLRSNKFSVPDVSNSNVVIYGYSKSVSFSLKNYSPGDYSPTLEISSSGDFERKSISLPGFRIDSPVDCVEVLRSSFDAFSVSYLLTVKNACESLDSYSFGNINFELQGNGISGRFAGSQKLYSISEYGSQLNFRLSGISNGTYFPSLYIRDYTDSKSKTIQLSAFTVGKSSKSSSVGSSSKQACVTGKNYTKECFDFPDWKYEICSSNPSGKVQYQSGSKWFFGWNFNGVKNVDRCESTHPFLVTINGTSKQSANLRLYFSKYETKGSFYSNFKVTIV
jgi:hypothetical protein